MVKFVNDALIPSVFKDSGIFVIDSDLQGTWATGEQRYFKESFPRLYDHYVRTCFVDRHFRVGSAMLVESEGYNFAILFTKEHRDAKKNCEPLIHNFCKAVEDLFRLVPSDVWIYSPILGRNDQAFSSYLVNINSIIKNEKCDRNWYIYTKKGYGDANNF